MHQVSALYETHDPDERLTVALDNDGQIDGAPTLATPRLVAFWGPDADLVALDEDS